MTSPDDDSDNSYSFVVNIALAPYSKKGAKPHENAVYNNSVRFQVVITKDVFGSVAHAARRFVEQAPSNIFLPQSVILHHYKVNGLMPNNHLHKVSQVCQICHCVIIA